VSTPPYHRDTFLSYVFLFLFDSAFSQLVWHTDNLHNQPYTMPSGPPGGSGRPSAFMTAAQLVRAQEDEQRRKAEYRAAMEEYSPQRKKVKVSIPLTACDGRCKAHWSA
jgi:hypothetical protein